MRATAAVCTAKCNWASLGPGRAGPRRENNIYPRTGRVRTHKHKCHRAGGGTAEQDEPKWNAAQSPRSPRLTRSCATAKTVREGLKGRRNRASSSPLLPLLSATEQSSVKAEQMSISMWRF